VPFTSDEHAFQQLGEAREAPEDYQPLVFIHIPKTAGTSFRQAAEESLGLHAVAKDYGTASPATSALVQQTVYSDRVDELLGHMHAQGIQMLSGHFPAKRYAHVFRQRVRWCTFLRDPVQRVISEHEHLVRHGVYAEPLMNFCQLGGQRNKQIRMLNGLGPDELFFVGITEQYRRSIEVFNQKAQTDFHYLEENVARGSLEKLHEVPRDVLEMIREQNAEEIAFYKRYEARYAE